MSNKGKKIIQIVRVRKGVKMNLYKLGDKVLQILLYYLFCISSLVFARLGITE